MSEDEDEDEEEEYTDPERLKQIKRLLYCTHQSNIGQLSVDGLFAAFEFERDSESQTYWSLHFRDI